MSAFTRRWETRMLEVLTGTGLALSAGLNAYVPLIALGAANRFFGLVDLPSGWAWLGNEWVLGILAVLLLIEIVADKVPVVDSVNDWIQTLVRPASGGIVFGSGASSETVAVRDPSEFFASNQWIPIATGAVLALGVHLVKALSRPALNTMSLGAAAPVLSAAEDVGSVAVTVVAIVAPLLVIAVLVAVVVGIVWLVRRAARRRATAIGPEL